MLKNEYSYIRIRKQKDGTDIKHAVNTANGKSLDRTKSALPRYLYLPISDVFTVLRLLGS